MMKKIFFLFSILFLFTVFTCINFTYGQIIIESGPDISPIDMVDNFMGKGVMYDNVTYQGADSARGIFSNGDSTNLGLSSGIFLTSGSGENIPGPNISSNASTNNALPGHPLLTSITTSSTSDASVLEFDFVPESDTLRFKYVFGGEEYNEYVIWNYDDVFGCFVSGPDPLGGMYADKNIAIVPGTTNTSVTINNVNNGYSPPGIVPTGPCTNCAYYSDNTNGLTLEYDGFTTVLVAWLLVVPCELYHIKLGVADAYGPSHDCGVFIEENSISFPEIDIEIVLDPPGISNHVVEGFVDADVIFRLPGPEYAPDTIYYTISGTAINGIDFEEIPGYITFEQGTDSASIHISPIDDDVVEGEEIIELIIENDLGCIIRYDTVVMTILDYVEMAITTSPNTMMCTAMEVDLWVQVYNGFPPYTYFWEPGGYTNDTITVSPDESTTYYVTCTDTVMQSVLDSVEVTVIPHNVEILTYSFEAENNPQLSEDIIGEIFEDSISLVLPVGSNPANLIATFTLQESAYAIANGEVQESGITPNDFTNPIIYHVLTPWGCMKYWTVVAHLETGILDLKENNISVYPNPAKDEVYISNARGFDLTIINNLGVKILEKRISNDKISLNLFDIEKGVYYFQFNKDENSFIEKVIINR